MSISNIEKLLILNHKPRNHDHKKIVLKPFVFSNFFNKPYKALRKYKIKCF